MIFFVSKIIRSFYTPTSIFAILFTMKQFTITYRDKDGRQAVMQISAEDRQGVFAELAKRRITAVRIEESKGKLRSPRKSAPRAGGKGGLFKGLVAGLFVVAAGIVVMLYLIPKGDETAEPSKNQKTKKIVEAQPAPRAAVRQETPAEVEPQESKPESLRAKFANMSEDEKLEAIEKRLADTPIPDESTNRTFRTGLEQVMGWVFTTEVGDAPPPLPNLSNFDLVHINEILEMKNPVRDTDSDKAADSKETVDFVKQELKKYLEKGGAPQEFLAFYHAELKQAYQARQMVQQQAMQILKEEPDLVFDFLEQANKGLAEKGIKAAVIPKRVLMRYGITEE